MRFSKASSRLLFESPLPASERQQSGVLARSASQRRAASMGGGEAIERGEAAITVSELVVGLGYQVESGRPGSVALDAVERTTMHLVLADRHARRPWS